MSRLTAIFILLLIVLATTPWLPLAPYYFLDDGFLHLFRLTELDAMLHGGIVYPRWSANFAYGYGYPIFNFYAPLAYYIAETIHLLGVPIPGAIQVTLALIVALAACGAYGLGRALFDSRLAGWLSAGAYIFFPYLILDVYIRGALAEALAAALLPWVVWALRHVIQRRTLGALGVAAFAFAAFVLAHNLTALLSAPFLAVYAIWEIGHQARDTRRRAIKFLFGAMGLGVALSAVYWLPTIVELPLVAVSRSNKALTALLDASFLAPSQLVQFALPYAYVDQPYPLALASLIPAALALVFARRQRTIWIFGGLALFSGILLLDFTREFWHAVPLLKTAQFAWRVQVLTGLSVALLTGAIVTTMRRDVLRVSIAGIITFVLAWNALAHLAPQRLDHPQNELSLAQMARFEVNTRGLGFGSFAEYLPLTVQSLVTKLDARAPAAPPSIALESLGAQRLALRISSSHSETVLLRTFYFPGWQATLDGQPLDLFPSTPLGLITFDAPPGTHRVVIWFGDTLPRQSGALVSGGALVAMLGATLWLARKHNPDWRALAALNGIALALVLPATWVALTAPNSPTQSTQIEVSSDLRLIGIQVENATLAQTAWRVAPNQDVLPLDVVWFVRDQIREQPFVWRLVGDDGRAWATRAQLSRFGTGFPNAWAANEIVRDHFELPLDFAMPVGKYQLQVGLGASPRFAQVGFIELTQPLRAPSEPSITRRADALVGDRVRLLGANVPARANPGEHLPVKLFWRAEREVFEDFTVFAQLLDREGKLLAQHDGIPHAGFLPTMLWYPGRIVEDARTLAIPRDATPGVYRLHAGLYRFDSLERLPVNESDESVDLGEVKIAVSAPNKPRTTLNAQLGDVIRLDGFDADARVRAGQTFALTLHWQALNAPQKDYKVFVHVLDANDQVVAQQDNAPRQNYYPTRIWDAGERVPDAHTLNVPPGKYTILVGMYDPVSGERLPAFDAQGHELSNRAITFEIEVSAR